jgi:hypothetical protein
MEFSEIPRPLQTAVWNLHKQYMESGTTRETRRQVKPIVVENYYKNLSAVELGNTLSYWDTYLSTHPVRTTPVVQAPPQQPHHQHQPRQQRPRGNYRHPRNAPVPTPVPAPGPTPAEVTETRD